MDFQPVLESWDAEHQEDFNDELATRLSEKEHELPLDDFCEEGGWPEDWCGFEVSSTCETETELVSVVLVHFTESVPSGCRDHPRREKRNGKLIVKIDKQTGSGSIESSDDYERHNPEYY